MNRFINYYKKIFSQEYMDRTISGGIKSFSPFLVSMQLDGKEHRDNKKDSQHRSNGNE